MYSLTGPTDCLRNPSQAKLAKQEWGSREACKSCRRSEADFANEKGEEGYACRIRLWIELWNTPIPLYTNITDRLN